MGAAQRIDLGAGVQVEVCADGTLKVASSNLDLGWQARRGPHPGSAIIWLEEAFEVVTETRADGVCCWLLQPWPEGEIMRTVDHLDRDAVSRCQSTHQNEAEDERRRRWSLAFAPIVGLVPQQLQLRWHNQWGFPSHIASLSSALLELSLGSIGLIQVMVLFRDGEWFLPKLLHWLAAVGPLMMIEGLARLGVVFGQSAPAGSVVGLPLRLLVRPTPPPPAWHAEMPEVRRFDQSGGVLELWSAGLRRDWEGPGVLPYRGRFFQLESLHEAGRGSVYRFQELPPGAATGTEQLRLLPPHRKPPPKNQQPPPNIFRTAWFTMLVCLAPRRYQESWGIQLKSDPRWFTVLGSVAELLGGAVNLGADLKGANPLALLDLYLIGEGLARLAMMTLSGDAVGSVLGIPLKPIFERSIGSANNKEAG